MTPSLKRRLSVMMFLEYSVPGAIFPAFSYYLMHWLGFGSGQAGVIMAMPGLAAWVAPLAASHLAGRYISAERLLAWCAFLSAVTLFGLYGATSFWPVLILYFLNGIFLAPTYGLTNTVALQHIENPARDFGGLRMWGTVGWCVVAWGFGLGYLRLCGGRMPHAILLSGVIALLLAAHSFGFRPAPAPATAARGSYTEAVRLFRRPDMMLLCGITLMNGICHQYYYFGASPYLHDRGFPDSYIIPAMSLGQTAEFILLGLLGRCLAWMGMKRAMILGVLAQAVRMVIFAAEGPWWTILIGLSLHGLCYAFFFTTAYLYIDRHSTQETRASAQQGLTVLMAGCGPVLGFLVAGGTAHFLSTPEGIIHFRVFWLAPVALSLLLALILAVHFPGDSETVGLPPGPPSGETRTTYPNTERQSTAGKAG